MTEDDWYLTVLINNENVFKRIDVWGRMSRMPAEFVFDASARKAWKGSTTPASTTITKTRKGFDATNSSSPEQLGAAGKPHNTMLEDVDELMLAKTMV